MRCLKACPAADSPASSLVRSLNPPAAIHTHCYSTLTHPNPPILCSYPPAASLTSTGPTLGAASGAAEGSKNSASAAAVAAADTASGVRRAPPPPRPLRPAPPLRPPPLPPVEFALLLGVVSELLSAASAPPDGEAEAAGGVAMACIARRPGARGATGQAVGSGEAEASEPCYECHVFCFNRIVYLVWPMLSSA